jgi:hypothetical protein
MKTILVLIIISCPYWVMAQRGLKTMDGDTYDPKKQRNEVAENYQGGTVYQLHNTIQVQQTTGQTYDSDQLTRMARKDINGIAATVAGVDARPGEIPNIRNAGTSGTAYFVDGVRVYGALPILTK